MEGNRRVSFDDMVDCAQENGFRKYFETSALSNYRQTVLKMFDEVAAECSKSKFGELDRVKGTSFRVTR